MAIAYFDSSALVKLLVDEPGSGVTAQVWDESDVRVSARLAHPEVAAALSAARRANRLSVASAQTAKRAWGRVWSSTRIVELSSDVAADAAALSERHVLGGADAVHLASARTLAEAEPLFVAWDRRLRAAATESGFRVVPRDL